MRWAELGTVYRYEKAGVLHGLLRVRGFTQDDAHIICTPEQIESEIAEVLRFSLSLWKAFGFTEVKAYLATRPAKAVGEPARWQQALQSLEKAVAQCGLACQVDEGGGAFYGPKIDLKIKDAIGREWQTTTIQFDFNLPERFDMTYVGADGQRHRPYMVHRALLGSLERFFGVLVEHYAGAFPTWLAPEQVRVLPISELYSGYAREVAAVLRRAGVRVGVDEEADPIGAKIRRARQQRLPYMAIVGEREMADRSVAVRSRSSGEEGASSLDAFLTRITEEIAAHAQSCGFVVVVGRNAADTRRWTGVPAEEHTRPGQAVPVGRKQDRRVPPSHGNSRPTTGSSAAGPSGSSQRPTSNSA